MQAIFYRNEKFNNFEWKKDLPYSGESFFVIKAIHYKRLIKYLKYISKKTDISINDWIIVKSSQLNKGVTGATVKLLDYATTNDYVLGNSDVVPKLLEFDPKLHCEEWYINPASQRFSKWELEYYGNCYYFPEAKYQVLIDNLDMEGVYYNIERDKLKPKVKKKQLTEEEKVAKRTNKLFKKAKELGFEYDNEMNEEENEIEAESIILSEIEDSGLKIKKVFMHPDDMSYGKKIDDDYYFYFDYTGKSKCNKDGYYIKIEGEFWFNEEELKDSTDSHIYADSYLDEDLRCIRICAHKFHIQLLIDVHTRKNISSTFKNKNTIAKLCINNIFKNKETYNLLETRSMLKIQSVEEVRNFCKKHKITIINETGRKIDDVVYATELAYAMYKDGILKLKDIDGSKICSAHSFKFTIECLLRDK